jgi:hypothetical protein
MYLHQLQFKKLQLMNYHKFHQLQFRPFITHVQTNLFYNFHKAELRTLQIEELDLCFINQIYIKTSIKVLFLDRRYLRKIIKEFYNYLSFNFSLS